METQLLDKRTLCDELKISPRCLESWVAQGRFPCPVRIGRLNYWHAAVVERWLTMTFSAQRNWNPTVS
jgi:predicted DNA-binding transcriptional regulator AlpA